MKRKSGGGRPKSALPGGPSSQKYNCPVPGCNVTRRSDKLRNHYRDLVKFGKDNKPIPSTSTEFRNLSKNGKEHTQYFLDHGYHSNNYPPLRTLANAPESPFALSTQQAEEKKARLAAACEEVPRSEDTPVDNRNDADDTAGRSGEGDKDSDGTDDEDDGIHEIRELDLDDVGVVESMNLSLSDIEEQSEGVGEGLEEHSEGTTSGAAFQSQSDASPKTYVLSEKGLDDLAEKLASMLVEKKTNRDTEDEKKFRQLLNELKETDDEYICLSCIKYSHSEKVPKPLRVHARGTYGFFKKLDATRLVNKERRTNIKQHFKNPLHTWCDTFEKLNNDSDKANAFNNKAACMKVVTNAIFCLKHSLSSKDFVRLNDKDNLVSSYTSSIGGEDNSCATKNDGSEQFFYFRDIIYEKLRKWHRELFKNTNSSSVTLDKVTVGRIPFTVLMSYFFKEGRIRCLLNKLHPMKSNEYDGENTANMVGIDMMASLGLTREEVKNIVHHFVYDGVYATPEERVAGGGCLSLIDHFADWCGSVPGSVTGNWDMGHKLQLVYGDVMLKEKVVVDYNKFVFGTMSDYTSGKDSLHFKELSEALHRMTLSNKVYQETRWVRAMLTAYQSFYHNSPTFYTLYGIESSACATVGDLTTQKTWQKKIQNITDGKQLAFGIGICQMLEVYAKTSLTSQHVSFFATTVVQSVHTLSNELDNLGKEWKWSEENLKFVGIGTPSEIITMLRNGTYTPTVTTAVKQRFSAKETLNRKLDAEFQKELEHDWENAKECIIPSIALDINPEEIEMGAGEIPVVNFGESEEGTVVESLKSISAKLSEALKLRLKVIPIIKSTLNAFSNEFIMSYRENLFFNPAQITKLKERITEIVEHIQQPHRERFAIIDNIVLGYNLFLKFAKSQFNLHEDSVALETIYEHFWIKYHTVEETEAFRDFFEFVQGKTFSEAICESIGTIMNMACGTGRNLHPSNFAKEIFIRFNCPPMDVLMDKFIPEIVEEELGAKKKQFIRKADANPDQLRKLRFQSTSSSIGNFRKKELESFLGWCGK